MNLTKTHLRYEANYTRDVLRQIALAMTLDDWEKIAVMSNELSALWATISQDANERAYGGQS